MNNGNDNGNYNKEMNEKINANSKPLNGSIDHATINQQLDEILNPKVKSPLRSV